MSERGARWLLVVLVVTQLVLLSRQASRRGPEAGSTPVHDVAVALVGPLAGLVEGGGDLVSSAGRRLRTRGRLQRENRELRERLEESERELLRLAALQGDFERLALAVRYVRESGRPVHVADVVYADYASWLRSLLVSAGERGAVPNQPVVNAEGLVGRVVAAGGGYAKVQIVTDRASAVGAMIERTRRQGIVRGAGGDLLELDYVPLQADVQPGDRIVTAGIDGIYPRGIAIGVVRRVEPGPQLFHRIEVIPEVDFASLDHVFLLPAEQLPALSGADATPPEGADGGP